MKEFFDKNRKWLGYTFFFCLSCLFFLYYRFPGDLAAVSLQDLARRRLPDFSVQMARVEPCLPLGLRLADLEVGRRATAGPPLFQALELSLTPNWLALAKGRLGCGIDCRAYQGEIAGRIALGKESGKEIHSFWEFAGLVLEEYPYLSQALGRRLEGRLAGTVDCNGLPAAWLAGQGEATLRLTDGRVALLAPVFGLETLNLQDLQVEAAFDKGAMKIRLILDGREIEGELAGNIRLREDLQASALDLEGTIQPAPEFLEKNQGLGTVMEFFKKDARKGAYRIEIFGTLREPRFKII